MTASLWFTGSTATVLEVDSTIGLMFNITIH